MSESWDVIEQQVTEHIIRSSASGFLRRMHDYDFYFALVVAPFLKYQIDQAKRCYNPRLCVLDMESI